MNNKYSISVLMSVYNSETTIEKSITSIINQSYKNFEFLIMDDFSNDNRNKNFQNARIKFPTSGLFNLIFYVKSWKDISPDNSEIVFFKRLI